MMRAFLRSYAAKILCLTRVVKQYLFDEESSSTIACSGSSGQKKESLTNFLALNRENQQHGS
ncbi:hypothetical protein CSA56_09305 [candidate division KSB3 bacterium]|uniref:Uncharacterized protein n=1 Tax=candidate division KSB3 bacterium TaxID=2044937 RepID=A0A2G6KDW8_9BACT|nr:MAG: hypothetical protein CSA56_09305 [candidate division KSB3 bacterium]